MSQVEQGIWIALHADAPSVLSAVCSRFEEGPFRPARDGETPHRIIEVGRTANDGEILVHEHGVAAPHFGYLQRWLTEKLAVPTRCQCKCPMLFAEQLEPSRKKSVECATFDVTTTERLARFDFVIDDAKQWQWFYGWEDKVVTEVASVFPIVSRSRLAHLACERVKCFGPNAPYAPGVFRYQMDVATDLKLSLFAPARNDDELRGPLLEVRHEKLVFTHYKVLAPNGSFVWRGEEQWIPGDEYGAEFSRMLRAFTSELRDSMSERTDWGQDVTPKTLVDPES